MGPSASGKSECALDLIVKGHKFIADDVVRVEKGKEGELVARPLKSKAFLLNIRGVGMVDIKKIYGESSVCRQVRVDLVVELASQDNPNHFDLLGNDDRRAIILDVLVKKQILPSRTCGSLANIVELLVKKTFISPS